MMTHELDLDQDSLYGEWEAFCSCGWTSPPSDRSGAREAWLEHCDLGDYDSRRDADSHVRIAQGSKP